MYSLYFNKDKYEIVLKKMGKTIIGEPTEEVSRYNNCYYVSTNRKALKQKALEIKEEWIKEAKETLKAFEDIKI